MAIDADATNNIRLRYGRSLDSEALDSQLYIFKNQKKIIKDQVKKSFGQMINSLYPFYQYLPRKYNEGQKSSHTHRYWHYDYGCAFSSSRKVNSRTRIIVHVFKSAVDYIWNSDSCFGRYYSGNRDRFEFYQKKLVSYTKGYSATNFVQLSNL